MANRWKGNFVVATAATSSGTAYTGKANGSWSLNNQLQQKQGSLWAAGIGAPSTPTGVSGSAGNTQATIVFTDSTTTGGGSLTYTATSSPGNITATGSTSPITVTGLTNGTTYTFTVTATNTLGYTSAASLPSNSVTPMATLLAYGNSATPGSVAVYDMTASTFGAKYSNPVTTPTNAIYGLNFSPNNAYFAVGMSNATATNVPIFIYPWNNGYGTKFADPTTAFAFSTCQGVLFDSTSTAIIAQGSAAGIVSYKWSSSGFGTRYAAPATTVGSNLMAVNTDRSVVAVTTSSTPFIHAYPWSYASGWGTKYANPSSLPTGYPPSICFNPAGTVLAIGQQASPYVMAYAWSAGFGTKFANPSTLVTGQTLGISFAGNSDLIVSYAGTSLAAYAWSSGFGSKYANPSVAPGESNAVAVNASNNTIGITTGGNISPTILAYSWTSGTGFGAKLSSPSGLSGFSTVVCFSN